MREQKLEGLRVAILGPRKTAELGRMIEKQGGIPLARPAQGTSFMDDEESEAIMHKLVKEDYDWFLFTTGIGIDSLLQIADRLGLREAFLDKVRAAKIGVRGYKAAAMLKKLGLEPVARDDDGTTAGLVRVLEPFSFTGCKVALQLHGDPAPKLVRMLQEQGARFQEILPYRNIPPEEAELDLLLQGILEGEVDAATFTSGAQVRFLFAHARNQEKLPELLSAFEAGCLAVAVGKYTAECLREEGIRRVIFPQEERMAFMVTAMCDYVAGQRTVQ